MQGVRSGILQLLYFSVLFHLSYRGGGGALPYLRLSAQKFGLSMFVCHGLFIQVLTLHVHSDLLLPHGLLARFFTHLVCGEPQCPRQH